MSFCMPPRMQILNNIKRIYLTVLKSIVYIYYNTISRYVQMLLTRKLAVVVLTSVLTIYILPRKLPSSFVINNSYLESITNYMTLLHEKYVNDEPLPAEKLKHSLKPKHPVIIIPGICSTTLELWQGINNEFRTTVWGKSDMLLQLITDVNTWADRISLDAETGLDKKEYKVRPANGLSSSDYILHMYWVWQKMLNNFGIIGYDHLNLHVSTYDWRLSCENLDIRDKYFLKLKLEIEMYYKLNNQKVVLLTHSLGSIVTLHFFNWVETIEEGFVDKYIHTLINIAAPFLGVSKSIGGLLSGESKATSSFFEGAIFDFLIHADVRKKVFQSWGSLKTLLPKGGEKIWGSEAIIKIDGKPIYVDELMHILRTEKDYDKALFNKINEVEDTAITNQNDIAEESKINMELTALKLRTNFLQECLLGFKTKVNKYKVDKDEILKVITSNVNKMLKLYKTREKIAERPKENREAWVDPTKCKLPNASNLKIYSCYGIGKDTERGYYYTFTKDGKLRINTKIQEKDVINGIKICDGDGTVPLFSLGYMGYRGWKNLDTNPAGIKTYIREYRHKSSLMKGIRGGPDTSEHVDILGNYNLTADILKICCGEGDEIEDEIVSNIKELSDEIDADQN